MENEPQSVIAGAPSDDDVLTPNQVGQLLGIPPRKISKMIREGKIRGVVVSDRIVRTTRGAVYDFVNGN